MSGADIRYTLNGQTPGPTSTLYVGPFQLPTVASGASTVVVRAYASKPFTNDGPVVSAVYSVLSKFPFLSDLGYFPLSTSFLVSATICHWTFRRQVQRPCLCTRCGILSSEAVERCCEECL